MRKLLIVGAIILGVTPLMAGESGCGESGPPTSDQVVQKQQENNLANASRDVGMPAITNYTEKRLVKQLYEMRDDPKIITYTYLQGIDGRLTCLGQSVGYGVPYAVQFSNPQQQVSPTDYNHDYQSLVITQAEPNGLFPPSSTAGTWVFLYDPETKRGVPTYVEPNVTVSRFPLTGPAIAHACS